MPELLAEKIAAPTVEGGEMDLVIDPTNLWLTIHESIGHATELDRAMGYEAAYAGTSFATFDKLGTLRYGSPVMHVTGDRTTPTGWRRSPSTTRASPRRASTSSETARWSATSSTGPSPRPPASTARTGAPTPTPPPHPDPAHGQRLPPAAEGEGPTTADLIAGVRNGLYIEGDKSWSIDMQRHNFQFTGQRFFRIVDGKLAGQVRDVAYQASTTEFWGAMEAVGGRSTYRLGGAFNCGRASRAKWPR